MAGDEPPGSGPGDAGEEASGRATVAGATADGPCHRAERREEKRGEDEIVGEVASLVRGHRGTVAKGLPIGDWGLNESGRRGWSKRNDWRD